MRTVIRRHEATFNSQYRKEYLKIFLFVHLKQRPEISRSMPILRLDRDSKRDEGLSQQDYFRSQRDLLLDGEVEHARCTEVNTAYGRPP